VGPLKDAQGRIVQEGGEVAELLNRFFSSVFTRENVANIPEPEQTGCREEITGLKIRAKEVKAKIQKLRTEGASGQDKIGPLLLKQLVQEIAWPLSMVMRTRVGRYWN
jgi:hypothetical protein